jgi:hypothetical protein
VHIAILLSSNGKRKREEETERSVDRPSRSMCTKKYKEKKNIYINKKKKKLPTQQGHIGKLLNSDEYTYTQTHHSKISGNVIQKKRKEQKLIFL